MRRFAASVGRAVARGREAYLHDEAVQALVHHNLVLLGEAANRVRRELQTTMPEVPWARIVALRNRLLHQYDRIDTDVVWEIATKDVAALHALLDRLLDEPDAAPP